jgi:acetyl esterase/lipase
MPNAQDGDAGSDWRGPPHPDTIRTMETIEVRKSVLGVRRVADLRLRGPAGSIPVRLRWPRAAGSGSAAPLVVFLPDLAPADGVDGADDALGHELCARVGAVVLCVPWAPRRPGALDRAEAALVWAGDHGAELGADPSRLVIAGRGAGAAAAAVLALRACDRGWPGIRRQVLILADAAARRGASHEATAAPRVAGAPAPAILVDPGAGDGRCSEWLRATGADVEELRGVEAPAASALADPVLADLVSALRAALDAR